MIAMGKHDIQYALDWISWRLIAHNRKFSQDYLDKMAAKKLREADASPHTSKIVRQRVRCILEEAEKQPRPGLSDRGCNELCKQIIREASEDDFMEMLAKCPCKLVQWRKLWNSIRANRIRTI